MNSAQAMKEIMENRYSCRNFNEKIIDEELLKEIINQTRLSPSAFGIEPWKFMIVSKNHLKELSQACHSQKQIEMASHAVVIVVKEDFGKEYEYIKKVIATKNMDEKSALGYYDRIVDSLKGLKATNSLSNYLTMQSYIALANLVNIAYANGINSSIIGGFDFDKLQKFVNLGEGFRPSIVVALGYCDDKPSKKYRLPLDEVLIYKK